MDNMLFRPATRVNDPHTSYMAEEKITESGKRQTHAMMVNLRVIIHPGLTTAELAQFGNPLSESQIHKRMHDLEENGLIRKGKPRKCRIRGSLCSTWWAVKENNDGPVR